VRFIGLTLAEMLIPGVGLLGLPLAGLAKTTNG
jgi:hypothetical protein